jgi:outer membrane protein assembly factor BamB
MDRFAISALTVLLVAVAVSPTAAADTASFDWPYWRGPLQNHTSYETGLPDDWNPEGGAGSNVVWQRDDLGGRCTPTVMGGKLYLLMRDQPSSPTEGEKVVCLHAATGETLWEHRFNVYLSDVPNTRVGWSSVVGDPTTGRIYAQGVCGVLLCLEGDTGEVVWRVPMHEKFGLLSTYGGRTNFPIVFEDLVITSAIVIGWGDMAKPAHRFLAFNKATGEVVWFNGTRELPYDTTYSSPTITVLGGKAALVFGSGDGAAWAFEPRTGRPIWQYRMAQRGLNASPLVVGDRVFIGNGQENLVGTLMGALVCLDGTMTGDITGKEIWRLDQAKIGGRAPVLVGERLFAVDDRAKLFIVDANTGEEVVRRKPLGTYMFGTPLYADGKIYVITQNGRWYILKPDDEAGVTIVSRGRFDVNTEISASPIVSNGRLYIHTSKALYCVADESKEHGATPMPTQPTESPVESDPEVAHVQIVPAEVLMRPGEKQQFQVRLFNSRGQLLEEAPATFALDGPGEISKDGNYVAAEGTAHTATNVTATVGDVTGRARVRVVPALPWRFDFEEFAIDEEKGYGLPPVTFVGVRYRHQIRDVDGNKALVKITNIPKGARSRGWMGHPDLHDYTIQADVMAEEKESGLLPDIGLIAQGYVIDMQGTEQRLEIRSWVSELRMARSIDLDWQAGTWYTLKFQAANDGDQAVLRGKVWPKDETEPTEWMLEATDAAPNRTGSPGLFGNARNALIYIDNVSVTPN